MPVTIKDIAREFGISASTVSRILNGKSSQNKELIRLVKEKAKEMNYQVNTAAVGLRTNKTKLIGIVIPEINDDFFSEILSGVEERAEAHGYNLLICQSHESATKEAKLIKSLIACNVEGMLISASIESSTQHDISSEITRAGKKLVFFDRIPANTDIPYVTIQDSEGARKVTQHVIDQGRKSFIYVGLSRQLTNDKQRLAGVQSALDEAGIVRFAQIYLDELDQLKTVIEKQSADALVCYNDNIAAKALNVLKKINFKVPEQIAVSGFDNRAICELVSPSLTSVNHSTEDLGKAASEMLFSMLDDSLDKIENIVLPATVVVRESTTNLNK